MGTPINLRAPLGQDVKISIMSPWSEQERPRMINENSEGKRETVIKQDEDEFA